VTDSEFQAWEDYLLWLLGSLERTSEHPLAKAIVAYATDKLGDAIEQNPFAHPTDFHAITGRGASGLIMGKIAVAVGNRSFATVLGIQVPDTVDEHMKCIEQDGKTAILVLVDGATRCVLGIADEVKPDAATSIAFLREVLGLDVWMVSGDNSRTAAAISRSLGIPSNRVVAQALPATKLERIQSLQSEGRVVCMIGDGVNDSAALAQADVGIGMGTTGAEIAMEASDMILVKGKVSDVCTALHLSRAIFRRIQWNLTFSLVYNCMGIPIAAGALYAVVRTRLPPTVAALAMALSSISVVLSSLSLRLYRPPNVNEALHRSRRSRAAMSSVRERSLAIDNEMEVGLLSSDDVEIARTDSDEVTLAIDNRQIVRLERARLAEA
jgi:P-type Cu+ transporter